MIGQQKTVQVRTKSVSILSQATQPEELSWPTSPTMAYGYRGSYLLGSSASCCNLYQCISVISLTTDNVAPATPSIAYGHWRCPGLGISESLLLALPRYVPSHRDKFIKTTCGIGMDRDMVACVC